MLALRGQIETEFFVFFFCSSLSIFLMYFNRTEGSIFLKAQSKNRTIFELNCMWILVFYLSNTQTKINYQNYCVVCIADECFELNKFYDKCVKWISLNRNKLRQILTKSYESMFLNGNMLKKSSEKMQNNKQKLRFAQSEWKYNFSVFFFCCFFAICEQLYIEQSVFRVEF